MINRTNLGNFEKAYDYFHGLYKTFGKEQLGYESESLFYKTLPGGIKGTFQNFESRLEGRYDNKVDSDKISKDRFYETNRGMLFQTVDGEILEAQDPYFSDTYLSSQADVHSSRGDIEDLYDDVFNIGAGSYTRANFGTNELRFSNYTFDGLADGVANVFNVDFNERLSWEHKELNIATEEGINEIAGAVQGYIDDHHGNLDDLRNVFGWTDKSDKVSFTNDPYMTRMKVSQNGNDLELELDRLLQKNESAF